MRTLALVVAAVVLSPSCFAQTGTAPAPTARQPSRTEKPHLEFVNEYIRGLAAIENLRDSAEKDQQQNPNGNVFMNFIHTSTLNQLELGFRISILKSMRLNPPFETFIPSITAFYELKVALWKRLTEISSSFIVPKPDVDYGKLAAELPELRAQLDYIDQSLFQVTPGIFMTLIDVKPDSKGHVNHLIITKAEKAKLIDDLTTNFGSKLDKSNPNYTVAAAKLLKEGLLKDFKCSDEPWE